MKIVQVATAAALVTAMAVAAGPALGATGSASKVVAFSAKYSGTATTQVKDAVADISATGTGTGTFLGASKLTGAGRGDASAQPCVPFSGPGSLVGAAGTKLLFTVLAGSQGCGDEGGHVFSIVGKAKVTKGTGKLKKAKGILKFTGTYDRDAGTFSVKFKGKLTI